MAKAAASSARAPRGTRVLTQAFFSAAEEIPEGQRDAVVKAAFASIRDKNGLNGAYHRKCPYLDSGADYRRLRSRDEACGECVARRQSGPIGGLLIVAGTRERESTETSNA